MDVRTLYQFVSIVDEGCISKAAVDNYISRQALTGSINRLEEELGVSLLNRSRKGVALTPEGKCLYDTLLELKTPWEKMLNTIRHPQSADVKIVKLGLPMFMFNKRLLRRLAHFPAIEDCPFITIHEYSTEKSQELVEDGALDIAITFYPYHGSSLSSLSLSAFNPDSYLLLPENSHLANCGVITGSDLKGETLLFVDSIVEKNVFMDYIVSSGMNPQVVPRNFDYIRDMVASGEGLFIIPGVMALSYVSEGGIIAKRIADFPRLMPQFIVTSKHASDVVKKIATEINKVMERYIEENRDLIRDDGTIMSGY